MRYVLTILLFTVVPAAAQHISLLHQLPYNDVLNDIWGYTDPAGREYALVGLVNGVSIVDLGTVNDAPVELFRIPGPSSIWRDLKAWDGFAYVVNETDSGLLVIDLRQLPADMSYQYVQDFDNQQLTTAHNLYIDEKGIGYLFGANLENGGAMMIDLTTTDRFAPTLLGYYKDGYIHDGYVRGDTLWAAEIYNGFISVVDVRDKAIPRVMATFDTPDRFAHNCWLSDDGQYLITTDERANGSIGIYDVSDLSDITRTDTYLRDRGSGLIPHNTYWLGDYIVTSYYRQGVTIVEATVTDNLVETGWYDTSPFSAARGFEGCWGVYPYLPSGRIIASDREQGLFVLTPTFTRAARLTGMVSDQQGQPLPGAIVTVESTPGFDQTDFTGTFATGAAKTGMYNIRVYREGCNSITIPNISLFEDSTVYLPITYACTPVGIATKQPPTMVAWQGDCLWLRTQDVYDRVMITDVQGRLLLQTTYDSEHPDCIPAPLPAGTYVVTVQKDGRSHSVSTIKP